MVALPLFDVVLCSDKAAAHSHGIAARLIEATRAELQQIEEIDGSLAPQDPTRFDRQTAALIRGMYEQWASQTEALLDRISEVQKRFGPVAGVEGLRDALGRTRAMLSISLDSMEEARRQVAEGRLIPVEEVRRELRLEVH